MDEESSGPDEHGHDNQRLSDKDPAAEWAVPGVTAAVDDPPPETSLSPVEVLAGVRHEVVEALTLVEAGVTKALAGYAHDLSLTDAHLRSSLLWWSRLSCQVEAVRLAAVRACVSREPAGRTQGRATRALLEDECRRGSGQASVDVKSAELLDPDTGALRQMGAALAAGEISAEHLRNARLTVKRIPKKLLDAKRAEIDEALTRNAREWAPRQAQDLNDALLSVLDPDGQEKDDADAYTRCSLHLVRDAFGMIVMRGQLDSTSGQLIETVLDQLIAMERADSHDLRPDEIANQRPGGVNAAGEPESVADTRDRGRRRADALVLMAQLAIEYLALVVGKDGLPETNGIGGKLNERSSRGVPRIVIVAQTETDENAPEPEPKEASASPTPQAPAAASEPDQDLSWLIPTQGGRPLLAGPPQVDPQRLVGTSDCGRPISLAALEHLVCDSIIDHVTTTKNGRVVSMKSSARVATPTQTAAVIARDRGCVFPGCAAPPSLCQVHHVQFWSRGGPTEIDNLALVCWRHHQLIHLHATTNPEEGWRLIMLAGVPYAIRPIWQDPDQVPIRNTLPEAIARTRRAAREILVE